MLPDHSSFMKRWWNQNLSNRFLNAFIEGEFMTSLGRLFQLLTTRCEKESNLVRFKAWPLKTRFECPLVCGIGLSLKNMFGLILTNPLKSLYIMIIYPRFLLYAIDGRSKASNRSLYDLCFSTFTIWVACLWTDSFHSNVPFLKRPPYQITILQ